MLDVEQALLSKEYKKYIAACGELSVVDLSELNETQTIAFLLNVYQCMYIHYYLKKQQQDDEGQ